MSLYETILSSSGVEEGGLGETELPNCDFMEAQPTNSNFFGINSV